MRLGLANDALGAVVKTNLILSLDQKVDKSIHLELVLFQRLLDNHARRISGLVVGMRGDDGVLFLKL